MLRVAGLRALCGLRHLSTAKPLREPGVVGLPMADGTSLKTLADLYKQTLTAVKEIPADAAYRVNVEKITQHRLSIVDGSEDIADVEEKLGIGQLEEVIEIAQDELKLIPHMAEWKPWEVSEAMPPVKIELID